MMNPDPDELQLMDELDVLWVLAWRFFCAKTE